MGTQINWGENKVPKQDFLPLELGFFQVEKMKDIPNRRKNMCDESNTIDFFFFFGTSFSFKAPVVHDQI